MFALKDSYDRCRRQSALVTGRPTGLGYPVAVHLSGNDMTVAQRVAKAVLGEYGADLGSLRRGHGWNNATWLSDELVVRVAKKPGVADLLREKQLIALLPTQVGCPLIIDGGVAEGHEWVLSQRVPGKNLEQVWSSLDDFNRAQAIAQMWERVRHVHRVNVDAAVPFARVRSPFFSQNPAESSTALSALVSEEALTPAEGRGLQRVLDRFWAVEARAHKTLNHGDFCTPNALWWDGEVVALLDFEFAVIAPTAVDLNEVIKMAFAPVAATEGSPLRSVVSRIAASELDFAGGPDVLIGYSVMLEMWVLANEPAADGPNQMDQNNAKAMLRAFAEGHGGCFAPLLNDIQKSRK